jgi:syntaxin-binding protein 1
VVPRSNRQFHGLWQLTPGMQWKVLVIDETSKKIIDNVVKEDDILNHNIAS